MDRRGFLGAILAAGVAPAIVRASSLMSVRGLLVPTHLDSFDAFAQAMLEPIIDQHLQALEDMIIYGASVLCDGVRVPPEKWLMLHAK